MTNITRKQVKDFIENGKSLVYIIDYLYTLDYTEEQMFKALTGRGFNCNRELLADTFAKSFGVRI